MFKTLFVSLFAFLWIFAARANEFKNFTTLDQLVTKKTLESDGVKVVAIRSEGSDDIYLSYPRGLIGQSTMFGTTVIKVSDKTDAGLGNLKLAGFISLARSELVNTTLKQALVLKGAFGGTGSETEPTKILAEIPVTAITDDNVTLNLSALGKSIDIAPMLSEFDGDDTEKFIFEGSKTVSVDFSLSTLVFDIESTYKLEDKEEGSEVATSKEFTLTSRWFIKLNSSLTPFFVPRKNTEGVGFFTNGEANDYISRFAITDLATNPIKYYVKNVPAKFRPDVLAGFEDWNHKLQGTLGHNLLTYEVIEKEDPRYDKIIAGDIRYNVLEWDIDNKATYGGLGPNIKNSTTGETMAGHVLIQGPEIVNIYTKWFKVKEQMEALKLRGANTVAIDLEKNFVKELAEKSSATNNVKKFNVNFGKIKFTIPAQDDRLKDPLSVDPLDYYQTPEGYTFDTYMRGYWREIIPHELGHNIGLRHNFRGNLKDKGEGTEGSVSRSVMEYLGRNYRHLDRVSEYDVMAIAYGYLGKKPAHKDWYCTDEDQGVYSYTNSAECSSLDATDDPFSYLEGKVNRGLDLLLARNSTTAPEWTMDTAWPTMSSFVKGLAAYATTAQSTASTWTNFFGKEGRPEKPEEVQAYVIKELNALICGKNLETDVQNKDTVEAQEVAKANLKAYRQKALETLKEVPSPWSIVNKENFSCLE
jgi:hypothetical protein